MKAAPVSKSIISFIWPICSFNIKSSVYMTYNSTTIYFLKSINAFLKIFSILLLNYCRMYYWFNSRTNTINYKS